MKLVSVIHPALVGRVPVERLSGLDGMDVTVVASDAIDPATLPQAANLVRLPVRGRNLSARYAGLRGCLTELAADVIHLHADPASLLAFRISGFCSRSPRPGFVLDCEPDPAPAERLPWPWLRRRTLARVDALLAHDTITLDRVPAARMGGQANLAGPSELPDALPARGTARRAFDLSPAGPPVFGWAGPLSRQTAIDLLETIAACEQDLVLLIPAREPLRSELQDRADALDILDRIRLVDAALSFAPPLAAVDALIVAPAANHLIAGCAAAIERAQCQGVPIVYADFPLLAELVGGGGWPVRADDPALLAGLLDEISRDPACLGEASRAASAEAAARNSPEAAGAKLAAAIRAAYLGRRRNRVRPNARREPGFSHSGDGREASGT